MMQIQAAMHRSAMQAEPIVSGSNMQRQRSSISATIACQDCGNQAKKDCPHMRCRTCCKSRGFDCATHIRSTWVPAAKRRERQQAEIAAFASGQAMPPKSKRARTLALSAPHHMPPAPHHVLPTASYTSTSTGSPSMRRGGGGGAATMTAHDTSIPAPLLAIHQQAALPEEVRAQALFQCVRVTGIGGDGQEEEEDEFAYRAVVRIGGRIFRGLLHDQGAILERSNNNANNNIMQQLPGGTGNMNVVIQDDNQLQLGGGGGNGGGRSVLPISSALIDLAGIYATSNSTANITLLAGKDSNISGPF